MTTKIVKSAVAMGAVLSLQNVFAGDIKINGFGSVIGATVVDGSGYIAEYPNLGIYEGSNVDFGQESRLGVQLTGKINDDFNATLQLVSRAANGWEPEVGWAYLTYNMNRTNKLEIGRMRAPVYHFSEYMDVGYAYDWVRIPADAYSLDITNYNGVRYSYQRDLDFATFKFKAMYGHEKNEDVELMSYLFPDQIDREFKDLAGVVLALDFEYVTLRTSYVESKMYETRHLSSTLAGILGVTGTYPSSSGRVGTDGGALVAADTRYDISFFDASIKFDVKNVNLMVEYNKYKPFYESYFASLSYRAGAFVPYLMYSKFDLDEPWESHDTASLGLRYDFKPGVAFKMDVSVFDDTGYNPFSGAPNPVYKAAEDGDGDAVILSAGLDFIF